MKTQNPFRYFRTSPEVISLAVMMYFRFPLSFRNVEDLLHKGGIDVHYETVRFWWNRFSPLFASETLKRRNTPFRATQTGNGILMPTYYCHSRTSSYSSDSTTTFIIYIIDIKKYFK